MQPISISMNIPDRNLEKTPIERAITALAASVATHRQDLTDLTQGPSLDITFCLAYNGDKPEFDGMRMGGFSPEGNTLYFEAAIPERFNQSHQAREYVAAVMEDVITNAYDYFSDQQVEFDAGLWKNTLTPIMAKANNIALPL
ncbi:hypothetical protein MAH1_19870 [Sessilibacter sp. MAH1]